MSGSRSNRAEQWRARVALVIALIGLALMFAGGPAMARGKPASGRERAHPAGGLFLGTVPSLGRASRPSPPPANGIPPLRYHGGPVLHSSKAYAIFWSPSGFYYPLAAKGEVVQYLEDVAAGSWTPGNVFGALTQYCQGASTGATSCTGAGSKFVSYNLSYGAATTVATAFPANGCPNYTLGSGLNSKVCLTDAQIRTELNSVISSKGWPRGLGTEFFIFTPPNVGECRDAQGQNCFNPDFSSPNYPPYCGYHSFISSPQTLYAVSPWADMTGCVFSYQVPDSPYPNDDGGDVLVNVMSSEQSGTITDPLGTGWWETDSAGTFEIGDECSFLTLPTHYNGIGDYSQTINADEYLLQTEWSNRAKKCVESNTYPQPTGTFTATAGSVAHSESFASSVSDSDDTSFTYAWNFGDGKASSAADPAHTYAAPGNKTVTLTVFDPNGDQLHVVHVVSVS